MLQQFGLSFKDPLEMLVEWAKNIYQEIIDTTNTQTENRGTGEKQHKKAHKTSTYKVPLDKLEAELERLKSRISARSKATASKHSNNAENEIEEELRSIHKKYKL